LKPSQSLIDTILFHPQNPGWAYDTIHARFINSEGDTEISQPLTGGYGNQYCFGTTPTADDLPLVYGDTLIHIIGRDAGNPWLVIHGITIGGVDSSYFQDCTKFPTAIFQNRVANILTLFKPNLRRILRDSSLYYVMHFDATTDNSLPCLEGDTVPHYCVVDFIHPSEGAFFLDAPSTLHYAIPYCTVAFETQLGALPTQLRFIGHYYDSVNVVSLTVEDSENFSLEGSIASDTVLNGTVPIGIKYLGKNTGEFDTWLRLHLRGNYYSIAIDTTFRIALMVLVDPGSYVLEQNTDVTPDIRVTPNPTDGTINITAAEAQSISLQCFDILGRLISSQNINSGSNSLQLPNQVKGIVFLRFQITPDSGSPYIVSKKIVVQ
jgi:hypothetical protein